MRLCHSRMPFVRAYPRKSQEPPRSPDRGPFGIGLDCLADARGSLTPTSGRSPSSRASARAASTTTWRRRWMRSSSARSAPVTVGSCRCARITWSGPLPARRRLALRGLLAASLSGIGLKASWPSMGEGAGREPSRRHPAAAVHAAAAVPELRRAERLAARSMRCLGQGTAPSRGSRPHDLGDVRGRTVEPDPLCRLVRRLSCRAGHSLQDLPGSLRHQQLLGQGERRRSPCRNPGLCRPRRVPPGRQRCR